MFYFDEEYGNRNDFPCLYYTDVLFGLTSWNFLHLQAFASFDRDSLGFITKEDLHQIINAFCFVMSDRQFQVSAALLKWIYSHALCNTQQWK